MIRALCCLIPLVITGSIRARGADSQMATTPTGVRVLSLYDSEARTVAISVFVATGDCFDEASTAVNALAALALFSGSDNQSVQAVDRAIYSVGGSLEVECMPEYSAIHCVTSPEAFEDAMYIIGQALKHAAYEEIGFIRARREAVADAQRSAAGASESVALAVRRALAPEGSVVPSSGSADLIARVGSLEALRRHRAVFVPARTVVSVGGPVSADRVRRAAENQFVDYDRAYLPMRRRQSGATRTGADRRIVLPPGERRSAMVAIGASGPGVGASDYAAFQVLSAAIGGGKGSRLFRAVREAGGVGYVLGSRSGGLTRGNYLIASVEFDGGRSSGGTDALAAAETLMAGVFSRLLSVPITEAEAVRARNFAVGQDILAHERGRDRVFYSGWLEAVGCGRTYDEALRKAMLLTTVADINRVAERYLRDYVTVVVPARMAATTAP